MADHVVIDYRAPVTDFAFQVGDTRPLSLTYTDDNTPPNPINLTGYSAALTIVDGATTLATLTTANGGVTLGGALGTITTTPFAQSATWKSGTYKLTLTSGTGTVTTVLQGSMTIS